MDKLYSIDVSKCESVNTEQDIAAVLKSCTINMKSVALHPLRAPKGSKVKGKGIILKVKKPEAIVIGKLQIHPDFKMVMGGELELFIESKSIAYFFSVRILDYANKMLKMEFPKEMFRINRREDFRYSPNSEHPIRIEFYFDKIHHNRYVYDISGGGLSVAVRENSKDPFRVGGTVTGLKVFYENTHIAGLEAEILHAREKRLPGGHHILYGMKFTAISHIQRTDIAKNIFLEYRSFLDYLEKRLV